MKLSIFLSVLKMKGKCNHVVNFYDLKKGENINSLYGVFGIYYFTNDRCNAKIFK